MNGFEIKISSKQRAKLMSLASKIKPIFQIGKDGVSQEQLQGLSEALNKRELIKINVLKSSEQSAKELGYLLSSSLDALLVTVIGNKIVLYKRSNDKNITHIEI